MGKWLLLLAIAALAITAGAWGQNAPAPPAAAPAQGEAAPVTPAPAPAQVVPAPPAVAVPLGGPLSVTEALQMRQAGAQTLPSEHVRCTATCATVVPYYQQKYATLTTHGGDTQCWTNCWNQFGNRTLTSVTADQQRALWARLSPQYMRINQCAQTCWRKYHPQDTTAVTVAGLPSLPRPIVAATTQAVAQIFTCQPVRLVALPMIAIPVPPTILPPLPCPPVSRDATGRPPVCPSGLNTF